MRGRRGIKALSKPTNHGEQVVRFEVWGKDGQWRGSGRLHVFAEQTPAEMVGEAMRRLSAAGLLFTGDKFRVWQPQGFSAQGELQAGDAHQVSLSAKITKQANQPRG